MIGELGLTGEVRRVPQIETRLDEAKKLGFKAAVMPKSLMERVTRFEGLKLIPVARASELAKILS
jgi:DNA repair protein RadA/Sms